VTGVRTLAATVLPLPMPDPQYTTTDLHLASFLYCRAADLLGCVRVRPKTYQFHFRADPALHELLRIYWGGALTPVVPAQLLATPQNLKSTALGRKRAVPLLAVTSEAPHADIPNPDDAASSGFLSPALG
jgi:hypothetical protein